MLASRWDGLAGWARTTLALTAGVSAISAFSDNSTLTITFALITAAVSAVNAGTSPAEKAKNHRDAARAYGHLERPLSELLYKLDEYNEVEFVPDTAYDSATSTYYDASYYRTKESAATPAELRSIWQVFSKTRERVEVIDESAPSLIGSSWRRGSDEQFGPPRAPQVGVDGAIVKSCGSRGVSGGGDLVGALDELAVAEDCSGPPPSKPT